MGAVNGSDRQGTALTDPPADLTGFPTAPVTGQAWCRAHTVGRNPWWFSHDDSGRFDLTHPDGTCYLASSIETAVRERLGPTLGRANMISIDEADRMLVSRLPAQGAAADTTDQQTTSFGVTRELSTITPYDLPRRWAAALHDTGHDGLVYWPRFSPGASHRALALFGAAGVDDTRGVDPAPIGGRSAAAHAEIVVVGVPRGLTTVDPPEPLP